MARISGPESMPSAKKLGMLIAYTALVVVLVLAFGYTLVYTLGDHLRLPFHL